jgi:hypothetical protein
MLRCTHVHDQDYVLHLTDFDLLHEAFPYSNEIHIGYAIKSSALRHIQDCISLHLNYMIVSEYKQFELEFRFPASSI